MTYDDGTIAKVGDVVAVASGESPERYIIIGPGQGNFAKLLLIGTVRKEDSPLFGQAIIFPTGFTRSAPLSDGAPRGMQICRDLRQRRFGGVGAVHATPITRRDLSRRAGGTAEETELMSQTQGCSAEIPRSA